MLYKEMKFGGGALVETMSIEVDQASLTSDCWMVQIKGLTACKTCALRGKRGPEGCGGGGGETLKRLKAAAKKGA